MCKTLPHNIVALHLIPWDILELDLSSILPQTVLGVRVRVRVRVVLHCNRAVKR